MQIEVDNTLWDLLVNYECAFSQSETEKYFEWIIINNLLLFN